MFIEFDENMFSFCSVKIENLQKIRNVCVGMCQFSYAYECSKYILEM